MNMKKFEIVSIKKIEKENLLSKYSPIYLLAKKLKLKYLIKEENLFTGPAIGLASVIDKITKNLPIKNMLDLCCGTGALSKIALLNGVKRVSCLDLRIEVAKENLEEFKEKIEFIEEDVFKFKPKKFYDLIVLDAPINLIEDLLNEFIPKIKKKCNLFVMWHGSAEENEWNEWVRNCLRKIFSKLIEVGSYGEEISCCSSTKKGKRWLEKLFKLW